MSTEIDIKARANEEIAAWFDMVWNHARQEGITAANEAYGAFGQTTTIAAIPMQTPDTYAMDWICKTCNQTIGPHGGAYEFCPKCGRKITEKDTAQLSNPENNVLHGA